MVVSETFVCTPVFVCLIPCLPDYLGIARYAFRFLKPDQITLAVDIVEINDGTPLSQPDTKRT
jgi:hypothetical protein